MALSKAEEERLALMEHYIGAIIGYGIGGPQGVRIGNAAVDAFQFSPINNAMKDALFSTLPDRSMPIGNMIANSGGLSPFPVPGVGPAPKKKRKASAYSKRYGKCFKKLQPKFKKKNGQWKKDGFKRCAAAARKCAKK
jgi:hypothetical protein